MKMFVLKLIKKLILTVVILNHLKATVQDVMKDLILSQIIPIMVLKPKILSVERYSMMKIVYTKKMEIVKNVRKVFILKVMDQKMMINVFKYN